MTPRILLEQVRNTAAWALEPTFASQPARILQRAAERLAAGDSLTDLGHAEYYELCLAAHHVTVATYVPTDVDNQIRFRLWHPTLPLETLGAMARIVLASRSWDFRPCSTRWIASPRTGEVMSGHNGEWFSTAVGAYCSMRKRDPDLAAQLAGEILSELDREADIFKECREARDGVAMHKAATVIAHNLGDLDRVFEMWGVTAESQDPLYIRAARSGHADGAGYRPELLAAGELNKKGMSAENHRHFTLRKPKCLRRSPDLLLPIAPFLDDWGARLARHPGLEAKEVGEIVEALIEGWKWLEGSAVGYPRAIAGILEAFPGGFQALGRLLPARVERELRAGELRRLTTQSKARFEETWAKSALHAARI